jgi:hypothetical protein
MGHHRRIALAAVACVLAFTGRSLAQVIVFDNTVAGTQNAFIFDNSPLTEFGNEVLLGGTARLLTNLKVVGTPTSLAPGTTPATLTLYRNDGPGGQPGTVIYLTTNPAAAVGRISAPSNWNFMNFDLPGVLVPDSFTYTVSFPNSNASTGYGLVHFTGSTPSPGSILHTWLIDRTPPGSYSRDDFNNATSGFADNYAARITAVPEPAAFLLVAMAGVSAAARRARGRNRTSARPAI